MASEVLDGSKEEMIKIGLTVDALQIQSIDDGKLGYITAMSAPHNAAIQREAQIAQARGRIRPPPKPSKNPSGTRRNTPARPQ